MAKNLIKEADKVAIKAKEDARLWKKELQLADKREKDWRTNGQKILDRYTGKEKKKNRYNILWSNTEILRPAIYNTRPQPDVRRRFRDADPVGKAVSEVIERALYVVTDGYEFDCAMKNDVLDSLLFGRGISRIRYIPQITSVPMGTTDDESLEPAEPTESVDYELLEIEHVDWKDFRHGYGRVWDEVQWEGFRHQLTRTEAESKFGKEVLGNLEYVQMTNVDDKKETDVVNETSKVAEFWEIWDRGNKKVFFINDKIEQLLYPLDNQDGEPPLEFEDFFPNPEPLKVIENTSSLLPISHFTLYQEQADELDRLTVRIDRIIAGLKLRGVGDSKMTELQSVMNADDNEIVPIQNAASYRDVGGIEKAISWMPIEAASQVLVVLNESREKQKAIIDELTGISDIIRGVTDANETYGAQQLKSQYASVRLQRMQKEVQRYNRDILRLAAQVICNKFGADTLAQMTDLKFPTPEQKQMMQMQLMQSQQSGQPPPFDPAMLQMPTWDDIMQLMHSPALRQYRIDIETDSTIAGTLDSDAVGMSTVVQGIGAMMETMTPAVQSGALPVDAAKELALAVVRRARMGQAVEDAIEKMKAPNPPPPPPPDTSIQVAQIKADSDQKIAAMKLQSDQQTEQLKAQADALHQKLEAQRAQFADQLKHQHEQFLTATQIQSDHYKAQVDADKQLMLEQQKANNSLMEAKLDAAVKIIVAQISAKAQADAAEASASREVERDIG